MTELQWLIQILTKQKLSPALKDMFIQRIGEVEASLVRAPAPPRMPIPHSTRMLEDDVPPPPPRQIIPTEIITSKGNGTMIKGPRKF